MRKSLLAAAVLSTLAVPGVALAEDSPHSFTGNVGVFSQYIFRGLTQTNEDPAIQGGLDYSYNFGPASVYVGTWGSNISWLKENLTANVGGAPFVVGSYQSGGSLELDIYGGVKGNFGKSDFTYDVGYLYYWYPGDLQPIPGNVRANTNELYAALGWKWLSAKFSYSLGDTFAVDDAKGTYYLDLGASIPIMETGLTFGLHYGIQKYDGTDSRNPLVGGVRVSNDDLFSYNDWRVSLAYDLGKLSKVTTGAEVGIMYTSTSGADQCAYGAFDQPCNLTGGFGPFPKEISKGQTTVWLKKTF